MPVSKKPRKKHRPNKLLLLNAVEFVAEGLSPIAKHDDYVLDWKIKTSMAMSCLMRGSATKRDIDTLIAASNVCEALQQLGFGKEYVDVSARARHALICIAFRAVEKLRFVPTGPEIAALNELLELNEAQLEVITVRDMEKAVSLAKKNINNREAVEMPPVPKELLVA